MRYFCCKLIGCGSYAGVNPIIWKESSALKLMQRIAKPPLAKEHLVVVVCMIRGVFSITSRAKNPSPNIRMSFLEKFLSDIIIYRSSG
jgi:hypothetical protein